MYEVGRDEMIRGCLCVSCLVLLFRVFCLCRCLVTSWLLATRGVSFLVRFVFCFASTRSRLARFGIALFRLVWDSSRKLRDVGWRMRDEDLCPETTAQKESRLGGVTWAARGGPRLFV
ncbi:hypothetical protein HDV62DRAFT_259930 [Trichoderma sp. SZMC 28011]